MAEEELLEEAAKIGVYGKQVKSYYVYKKGEFKFAKTLNTTVELEFLKGKLIESHCNFAYKKLSTI